MKNEIKTLYKNSLYFNLAGFLLSLYIGDDLSGINYQVGFFSSLVVLTLSFMDIKKKIENEVSYLDADSIDEEELEESNPKKFVTISTFSMKRILGYLVLIASLLILMKSGNFQALYFIFGITSFFAAVAILSFIKPS